MTQIFLFDVDGTLTPPGQKMRDSFAEFFGPFVQQHIVFLISGSDYSKIERQVPSDILTRCYGVFGCSGAEYLEQGQTIYRNEHQFDAGLVADIERFIEQSSYGVRCGHHVDRRPGMLNVSVVGRNADLQQRAAYFEWDSHVGERLGFVEFLKRNHPGYEAFCGGEISIDIVPRGWNKSVAKRAVLEKFPDAEIVFFGDRMGPKGNDSPLADVLDTPSRRHRAIAVEDYTDTWVHLQHFPAQKAEVHAHTQFELRPSSPPTILH